MELMNRLCRIVAFFFYFVIGSLNVNRNMDLDTKLDHSPYVFFVDNIKIYAEVVI